MDTLDRFLLKEFFAYFILVLLGLAAVFLGIDFLTKFWNINMPIGQVFALYGYKLPAAIQKFVPVACLMATLLVLSGMSRQNEILALYTSGIGTLRLLSTFVAIAATISTFSFLVFDSLVPAFSKREIMINRGIDPSQEYLLNNNRSGFWYRSGKIIYNVGRYVPESNTLEDVKVYLLNPSFQLLETLRARHAVYTNNDWELQDGYSVIYPLHARFPVSAPFKVRTGVIPEKPGDFKTLKVEDETMRLKDLRLYIARNKSYGLDTTSQQVNYHQRLALVFTPLVFVLLGIPFAIRPLKTHSFARSIGFCFLVVFMYLLIFQMSLSIGKGGHIPPLIAGWAPNVLFLILSGVFIVRKM